MDKRNVEVGRALKVAIVLGTRAELIKMIPVMRELEKQKMEYVFIHTGQHDLSYFLDKFGIRAPDVILSEPPRRFKTKFFSRMFKAIIWSLGIVFKIRKALRSIKDLDYVIYHGDTMGSMSAAIASSDLLNKRRHWRNVHLESGLRSGTLKAPFPEEISRIFCDKCSDILFSVSENATANLQKDGSIWLHKMVYEVGNTVVDSIAMASKMAVRPAYVPKGDYALITLHRFETIRDKQQLKNAIDCIAACPMEKVWILHDNTKQQIRKFGLMQYMTSVVKNTLFMPETDYLEFIWLLKHCKCIMSDGGGVQEESLAFKKPCFILRNVTERTDGLKTGINFMTYLNPFITKQLFDELDIKNLPKFVNPYGKPGVSKRIVDILK